MTRVLWPSSLPLADFITEQALHNQGDEMCRIPLLARAAAKRRLNQPTGIRALELGAGCAGLPGMALAALVADEVTLTDVASALPLLEENVRRFTDAAAASGNTRCGKIDVRAFDWLDGEHIANMASDLGYDVVVGTDIAYADSLLEPLVRATMAVLKPGGVLLLSENLRSRRMHHEARAAFGKPGYFAVTVPQVGTFADHLEEEAALLVGTWQCESEARAMRRKLAVCKK
ncbi:protein N-lysine methyltransferase [Pseudoscourfieldia marina]